jgi:hypothetical protein
MSRYHNPERDVMTDLLSNYPFAHFPLSEVINEGGATMILRIAVVIRRYYMAYLLVSWRGKFTPWSHG